MPRPPLRGRRTSGSHIDDSGVFPSPRTLIAVRHRPRGSQIKPANARDALAANHRNTYRDASLFDLRKRSMALSEEAQRLVVILAVAVSLTAVVVSVALVPSAETTACPVLECGPWFAVGNPVGPDLCSGPSVLAVGCISPNDYIYTISIEASSVQFGQVLFNVTNSSGFTISVHPSGGFTIVNASGRAFAAFDLEAGGPLKVPTESGWTYFTTATGISAHSLLGSEYSIVVDMGTLDPVGQGDNFVATATVSGVGVIASLALP